VGWFQLFFYVNKSYSWPPKEESMLVLGIESTCDETAAAVVRDGHEILSNVIASQTDLHQKYGGVFPELACRRHVDVMIDVIDQALKEAGIKPEEIDLVAAARGPGLIGAIMIGLNAAKALALGWKKPFLGIHHVEAHLYASMIGRKEQLRFPGIGVVLSGGHTLLLHIEDVGSYQLIGTTLDDAIGEAFDKVGSLLGLNYPAGPLIEKLAKEGDPNRYTLPLPKLKNPYHFSYSGLKTHVLYLVKGQSAKKSSPVLISEEEKKHVAASFQEIAFRQICKRTKEAIEKFDCKALYFGGGVTCNQRLREMFESQNLSIDLFWPEKELCLDNAAMIAALSVVKFQKNPTSDPFDLAAMPRIPF